MCNIEARQQEVDEKVLHTITSSFGCEIESIPVNDMTTRFNAKERCRIICLSMISYPEHSSYAVEEDIEPTVLSDSIADTVHQGLSSNIRVPPFI